MNSKKIGNKIEVKLRKTLSYWGFFAHLLVDNKNGQPFDIIAIKNGKIFAIDSKASISNRFNRSRIEDNQYSSLAKIAKEGAYTGFAIYYKNEFYFLEFKNINTGVKSYEITKLPKLEEYLRECLLH